MYILLTCSVTFIASYLGSYVFQRFAYKNNIVAKLNFRTLHLQETPKSGGVIISFIYTIWFLITHYSSSSIDTQLIYITIGAVLSSLVGFVDDILDLKPVLKLLIQSLMAMSILVVIFSFSFFMSNIFNFLFFLLMTLFLVWVINSINFMDGIDGLCSSLTISILSAASLGMFINEIPSSSFIPLLILSSVCLGFLLINLSTKKLFMGDSGSLFLAYLLCAFALKTIASEELNIWSWSILFSFCLTETSATTAYRLLRIKKWYGAHRSHAYQNLARVLENHKIVTGGVVLYHCFWLAPLSFLSLIYTSASLIFLFLAIFPVLVFNLYYGPRYSSS